jgi:MoaA/NifB/PqqE/SkfB family radical SAM enzyme
MLTEENHAGGVADREGSVDREGRLKSHEDAAHEKRNWVRLTFACNDHCIFCLDSNTHNGEMRDREEVRQQIIEGRRNGATRLILSGGEPTIHPNYVDFIRLGRQAGYRKIQTVTNGRLFSYGDFLTRCLDTGLSEITFSVHGPNSKVHDALVGTKGAFEEEMKGLRGALADGRPIVNIDVVVNRGNVKQLPEMLRLFTEMGVREFDLLQVVPFGRAFEEGKDTLFYDLIEMRPYLQEALAYSKRPDIHLWMNRFPPQHLEGYEHLIQDPYKLNDEVRGRKEEYARLLDDGVWLDCRDPARCKYCYLEKLCDTLESVIDTVDARKFDVVRVDTEWEAKQPAVFGGDPASAQRARDKERTNAEEVTGKRMLPMLSDGPTPARRQVVPVTVLAHEAKATTLLVVAPDLAHVAPVLARFPQLTRVDLELEDYAGLADALKPPGALAGHTLARVTAHTAAQATELLALDGSFEVLVLLTRETGQWLLSLPVGSSTLARLALRQPSYERLTEADEHDLDLRDFFTRFTSVVPVEDVPACLSGRAPRPAPRTLDTAMMEEDGKLEVFRYARRYILGGYRTKSLRCRDCRENATCEGMHINHVRAHGYQVMSPIP